MPDGSTSQFISRFIVKPYCAQNPIADRSNRFQNWCARLSQSPQPSEQARDGVLGQAPTVGAVSPYSYAGNDTSHLWTAGIPCCLYGPAGGYDEGRSDRWTSIEQIVACARVYGATIADVCG